MKRFSGVLAVTLLVAGLIVSCASSGGSGAKLSFKPGVYTGTAVGHNGPLTVETIFDASSIKEVKIVKQMETPAVQQVINVVPEAIVAKQSLAVDTVTGATFCGRAVIAAVKDCVKQAGGDVAALEAPLPKEPVKPQSYEADVIVIGAGGAGMAAAVSAEQNGAKVIIIEKLGLVGGSTAFSGGATNAADPQGESTIKMTAANRATVQDALKRTPHDGFEAELQKTVAKQFADFTASGATGLFDSAEWHMMQTYNGGDTAGFLRDLRAMFKTGKTFMPEACRRESFETYFLGLGKK